MAFVRFRYSSKAGGNQRQNWAFKVETHCLYVVNNMQSVALVIS